MDLNRYKIFLSVADSGSFTAAAAAWNYTPSGVVHLIKELEQEFGVKHLPSDFKKQNGYLRSLQLSEEYGLYRQDYCGCEFSAKARGIGTTAGE